MCPDSVLVSHATLVLLREEAHAEPAGERVLPGAHHAVKLYALRDLSAGDDSDDNLLSAPGHELCRNAI